MDAMNPLKLLRTLVQVLQGGVDPAHAAAGFALGAAWGLLPKGNLLSVLFWLVFFAFRVDKGMALVAAALFTPVGLLLDAPAHALGWSLLNLGALKPLWTWCYGAPVLPWTRFNNTVVLGQLVIGAFLLTPLYLGSRRGVLFYRERWRDRVAAWPLMRALNGLRAVALWKQWSRP